MTATRALRVVVVDDVALARARLARLLAALPGIELAGFAGDADEAEGVIRRTRPDVLVLDIDLAGDDGFALLSRIEVPPQVVFCTAHAQHAARAFELAAIDYLLKPVEPERLREAMTRCLSRRDHARPAPPWLVLRDREATRLIAVDDIDWVEAAGNYVCIRTGADTYIHRSTLAALHERLDPARFVRIHRSRVVNLSRIARLEPLHNGDHRVVLKDGSVLVLSRTWREGLLARLDVVARSTD